MSLMLRNLVNRPDRSWSGASIVHNNTFSEPTRAAAQQRFFRGRAWRRKIMHKIMFADCIRIRMNRRR